MLGRLSRPDDPEPASSSTIVPIAEAVPIVPLETDVMCISTVSFDSSMESSRMETSTLPDVVPAEIVSVPDRPVKSTFCVADPERVS